MTHPIDQYLEALESYRGGQVPDSATRVTQALGGDEATEPIKSSLDKIFDRGSILHSEILGVIIAEAKRRERNG